MTIDVMVWDVLSNPTRRKIITLLLEHGEMTPTELLTYLDFTFSSLSVHLRNLIEAKLILRKRKGQHIFYSVDKREIKYSKMT